MDPATGLSLACNVLQLISVAVTVSKTFHEIYKSPDSLDSDTSHIDSESGHLRDVTSKLTSRLADVKAVEGRLSRDQKELLSVAQKCETLTFELLERIQRLKKGNVTRRWAKVLLEKGKIGKAADELRGMRDILNTELLVGLR